ncbi:serine hydrolase domain-containing protein [Paraliomyxa miuraensis]|uniref:serine hydrolase domain-containing protein n=1 Tax=Paraliomyxa miuraensis TaxID=376150 RepID=UPI002254CA83|nr:serine hydrolase domain-containing protein [Paraliomyxa miuraensis]MCX4239283.1 beta-lactamase family protein [Paraliomyxa miuraensis]
MPSSRISTALASFALMLACACGTAAPAEPTESADESEAERTSPTIEPLPSDLDHRAITYLEQYGRHWPAFRFHGAVLVARGDQIAIDRAFGQADLVSGVSNETTTQFRIGTLSAQLTAVTALRLAEAGVLDLQDPVAKHLPGWPGGDQITLEHLLTHRSGIPSFTDSDAFERWKNAPHSLAEILDQFRTLPLEFEPGTDTAPSNSNPVLLGAVLEAATGKPYPQVVAEQVLQPVGMEHTRYVASEEQQAIGMSYNDDELLDVVHRVHPSAFGPAGGWLSTTGDLLRLYRALAGESLLSRRSVAQMQDGGPQGGLGYGWAPTELAGQAAVSWPGLIDGFNSAAFYVPADDTTIIVLSNTEVVPSGQLGEDIAALIYQDELPRREEAVEAPIPFEEQLPAVGRYVPTRGTEDALAAADADSALIGEVYVLPNRKPSGDELIFMVPDYGTKIMHPEGKGRFFFKDRAQTRAEVIVRADQSALLVLESGDGELRFVRVPSEDPAKPTSASARAGDRRRTG